MTITLSVDTFWKLTTYLCIQKPHGRYLLWHCYQCYENRLTNWLNTSHTMQIILLYKNSIYIYNLYILLDLKYHIIYGYDIIFIIMYITQCAQYAPTSTTILDTSERHCRLVNTTMCIRWHNDNLKNVKSLFF